MRLRPAARLVAVLGALGVGWLDGPEGARAGERELVVEGEGTIVLPLGPRAARGAPAGPGRGCRDAAARAS